MSLEPKSHDELSDDEYALYTAMCQTNVYTFDYQPTIFACLVGRPAHFDGFPDRWSAPFRGPARYLCARQPEILTDFMAQNQRAVRLEKRFQLPEQRPYLLSDEVDQETRNRRQHFFYRFARCGFTADRQFALAYLQHANGESYYAAGDGAYFLFQREGEQWICLAGQITWICAV